MNSSCIFQHDVMLEILPRLPAKSLVRFRCVCKLWNSLFHEPYFVSQQLKHASKSPTTYFGYWCADTEQVSLYSFEVEANEVIPSNKFIVPVRRTLFHFPCRMSNSCNGLIAIGVAGYAYVANPCTREWMALPEFSPNIHRTAMEGVAASLGLGFSTATGKYKVVRYFNRGTHCECEVLTVGTDRSWRSFGKMPYPVTEYKPAYANGYIYWTVRGVNAAEVILSFDVCQEKFATIKLPRCDPEPDVAYRCFFISILEGSVCLVDRHVHLDKERGCYMPVMNIHVLKNPGDFIWTKSHSLRLSSAKIPPKNRWDWVAADNNMFPMEIKNAKVLLYCPCRKWRLHDIRTGACSTIRAPPLKYWQNGMVPFVSVESIVPLDRLPEDHPTPSTASPIEDPRQRE